MAEPLVLIPGMMCDARLFWPQIVAFSHERTVQVAAISQADTIGALAQQVLDSAPRSFALAGLSMGGIVAMEILNRAPDRVKRVALLDTNPLPETPQVAADREPQIIGVRNGRLIEVMRDEMKPNYLAPGPHRVEILQMVLDMAESLGPEVFVRQSRALQRRPDQQRTLAKTKVPALVLCGEHDTLCPVKRHQMMAELIPSSELVVVPDAGHLPVLEQPAAVNAALRTWLTAPLVLR